MLVGRILKSDKDFKINAPVVCTARYYLGVWYRTGFIGQYRRRKTNSVTARLSQSIVVQTLCKIITRRCCYVFDGDFSGGRGLR